MKIILYQMKFWLNKILFYGKNFNSKNILLIVIKILPFPTATDAFYPQYMNYPEYNPSAAKK